jgi:hypothetical protein
MSSILKSLLPPRYRDGVSPRAAMVSGILQTMGSLFLLVARAMFWLQNRTVVDIHTTIIGGGFEVPGSGIFVLAEFWLNPVHIFIFYLAIEGMVRTLAALAGHQVIGTLPLYVVSGIHGLLDMRKYKKHLGELVEDHVIRGGGTQAYDLKVYSCRPKLHWNPYVTIEFEDQFYQCLHEEQGASPRRFVYYLRKNLTGRAVVVVDHYKTDNVLKSEPDKWAGTLTVWQRMFPNWKVAPPAPDRIVRGKSERQDYDLKIYSCSRKEDWNTHVTIEFEEQRYRLVRDEKGTKSHPYVYYLRKSSETRPGVVVRKYGGV